MSTTVFVSVQATGTENAPWDGHRAVGVLATEEVVFVPDSPPELADARQWFEVLVIPTTVDGGPVERIAVAGVEALRRTGDGRVTSVALQLARWSRYPATVSPFNGCALRAAVRDNGGDVWAGLVSVGAVRPELREIPDAVLRAVPDLELAQRLGRTRLHDYQDAGVGFWDPCTIIKWPCEPCRP